MTTGPVKAHPKFGYYQSITIKYDYVVNLVKFKSEWFFKQSPMSQCHKQSHNVIGALFLENGFEGLFPYMCKAVILAI